MKNLNRLAAVVILCIINAHAQTIFRTYTTLQGFYDYQTNNTCQYIRVNPANGRIHVVYMLAHDSTNINNSRRTAYAYSSNGGQTWQNFSNVWIPARRSSFPSLDLLRGPNAGSPVIVNHNDPGNGLRSIAYVDSPEGSGAFSELNAPPSFGNDEPIVPDVAGVSDGSIVIAASRSSACGIYVTGTRDMVSFTPWLGLPLSDCSSRYVLESNDSARIGLVYSAQNSVRLYESYVGSLTWTDTLLFPLPIVIGGDTFALGSSIDFVYLNNEVVVAFSVTNIHPIGNDGAAIAFWSRRTGAVLAVPRHVVSGMVDSLNRTQRRHLSMGYPTIGISGTTIVLGFQAFRSDTSSRGYNYSDVFFVRSTDGGSTWAIPLNLSGTRLLDERYPSMSRWNAAGQANLVWQEDPSPGGAAFPGEGDTTRTRQVFCRVSNITFASEDAATPREFRLEQNYPNPFNPTTTIRFHLPHREFVSLRVFDVLGREVAMLVNEVRDSGEHEVQWDASRVGSGVFFYRLRAGEFVSARKMILIR